MLSVSESRVFIHCIAGQNRSGSQYAGGGGIHSRYGELTITRSTISANYAVDDAGGIWTDTTRPGGINYTAILKNSTVSGNSAGNHGGGIFNVDGRLVIEHTTITLNSAPAGEGGGVASWGDSATHTEIFSSIISDNLGSDVDFVIALPLPSVPRGGAGRWHRCWIRWWLWSWDGPLWV